MWSWRLWRAERAALGYSAAGEASASARCWRLAGDAEALQGSAAEALELYRRAAHAQIRISDWVGMRVTVEHAAALSTDEVGRQLGKLSTELSMLGGPR